MASIYKTKQKISSIGANVEQLEHLRFASRNVSWFSHCGRQYEGSSNIQEEKSEKI